MSSVFLAPELITRADVVADNVRAECGRRGVTGKALAEALGMKRTATGDRLRGASEWRLSELDAVARVLGVSIFDLLTPSDPNWHPRQDSNLQPRD